MNTSVYGAFGALMSAFSGPLRMKTNPRLHRPICGGFRTIQVGRLYSGGQDSPAVCAGASRRREGVALSLVVGCLLLTSPGQQAPPVFRRLPHTTSVTGRDSQRGIFLGLASLRFQCLDGIHLCRSPGGQIAGDNRACAQHQRYDAIGEWINGAHTEEKRLHQLR